MNIETADMPMQIFIDRADAGRQLAIKLLRFASENPIILALPRGGVPVGYEIARALGMQLSVIGVRKIGLPQNPEFGFGAIAEHNVQILDEQILSATNVVPKEIYDLISKERAELERRIRLYRGSSEKLLLENRTVIIVDDGLATGISAQAAIKSVKTLKPRTIIFASPVCALGPAQEMQLLVDELVCLALPSDFIAVGQWYRNFWQVTDEEVLNLLEKNKQDVERKKARTNSVPLSPS